MKILTTLAVLALSATTVSTGAQAFPYSTTNTFTDAKTGYVVAVSEAGGKMVLRGTHPVTGKTFKLAVSQANVVTGTWDGQPINYVMGSKASPKEVASLQVGGQ